VDEGRERCGGAAYYSCAPYPQQGTRPIAKHSLFRESRGGATVVINRFALIVQSIARSRSASCNSLGFMEEMPCRWAGKGVPSRGGLATPAIFKQRNTRHIVGESVKQSSTAYIMHITPIKTSLHLGHQLANSDCFDQRHER
jgi:hypothetical protein